MSQGAELYIIESPYVFGGFSGRRDKSPYSILGVPLDMTSSFRPGYRAAPLQIRLAAQSLEYFSMRFNIDVEDFLYVDEGDVLLPQDGVVRALEVIRRVAEYLFSAGRVPIFLGGEHTLTVGTARAAVERFGGGVCVLIFDAHADLRTEYAGTRYSHACVTSRLLELVGRESVLLVGTRALSRAEYERLKSEGIAHVTSRSIRRLGLRHAVSSLRDFIGSCSRVYLSVDMDVFDPAFAPGVATPEPEGISPADFLELLYEVVSGKFVAMDVVEVTPPYDPSMVTSLLAARIVLEFMAGLYHHSSKRQGEA